MTSPPIEQDAEPTGGGTPNVPALGVMGASISPASPFSRTVAAVSETLPVSAEGRSDSELTRNGAPVVWSGAPTKAMLAALRHEAWCDPWDQKVASLVLHGIWEGLTLIRACESVGVARSTVMAWRRLVPEFDAAVKEARLSLGEYQQELAVAEGDPAMMSARLRAAASLDKRLRAGGDVEEGGGGSITVQVLKIG
jgi:hypothetical protein